MYRKSRTVIKHILIIGFGLMGGSVALALKRRYPKIIVSAVTPSLDTITYALNQKIIDHGNIILDMELIQNADLVVVSANLKSYDEIFTQLAKIAPNKIVTDIGSVKNFTLKYRAYLPNFVPAHPIAGSQASGLLAAKADLFDNRSVFFIDPQGSYAVNFVAEFWQSIGMNLIFDFHEHDRVFAYSSHLPQKIMFDYRELIEKAGISLSMNRATRLSFSNKAMWDEIFALNSINLNEALQEFLQILHSQNICDRVEEAKAVYLALIGKTTPVAKKIFHPTLHIATALMLTLSAAKFTLPITKEAIGQGFIDTVSPLCT